MTSSCDVGVTLAQAEDPSETGSSRELCGRRCSLPRVQCQCLVGQGRHHAETIIRQVNDERGYITHLCISSILLGQPGGFLPKEGKSFLLSLLLLLPPDFSASTCLLVPTYFVLTVIQKLTAAVHVNQKRSLRQIYDYCMSIV